MTEALETRPAFVAPQIELRMDATSYAEVLDELAEFASGQPGVVDADRLRREIASLGSEDTVALGGGAFLAHLRSEAIEGTVVVLGITEEPVRVPTEGGEEGRGRVFVLVAAGCEAGGAYLEAVATIAALLRNEGVVEAILAAESAEEIAGLEAVEDAPRVQKLSVIDVMEPVSRRVYADMDLREAARLMTRDGHTGLPVVNRRDEIVGMISEKDLVKAFLPGYLRISKDHDVGTGREGVGRKAKDVMSRAVLCLSTDASISDAASIIVNKNVDPLPVTREGKWVGLISRRSLIRKLLQF